MTPPADRAAPPKRGVDALVSAPIADDLQPDLQELGLSPYEARVLLTLLRLGSGKVPLIADLADVPRTSAYQILESLSAKGLAWRVPGPGQAAWASPSRNEVFERLDASVEANLEERLRRHRERSSQIRERLSRVIPEGPSVAVPYVHVLRGPAQMKAAYEQLLTEAEHGFVMFTRPPYAWVNPDPNPIVLQTLRRGVRSRVLYERESWDDPSSAGFRQEVAEYHRAGVEARIAPSLPLKLVVVDDSACLVAMPDPVAPLEHYPMTFLIRHAGYAAVQAAAFEKYWDTASPLEPEPE